MPPSDPRCLNCGRELDPDRVRIDQASQTVYVDGHPLPMDERVCSPHCLGRLREWERRRPQDGTGL